MKLRVADEVPTILAESALEKEQIDMAMAAMGIAQSLGGGKRRRGTRMRIKNQLCVESSKTKVSYLGSRLTWNIPFVAEREPTIAPA